DVCSSDLAALLWCATVTLVTRRFQPLARLWLFLLPLCFEAAVAGLAVLADFLPVRAFGRRAVAAMSAGAVLLCAGLGLFVVRSPELCPKSALDGNNDCPPLREAEPLVLFMKSHLRNNDKVFASVPATRGVLEYYSIIHD